MPPGCAKFPRKPEEREEMPQLAIRYRAGNETKRPDLEVGMERKDYLLFFNRIFNDHFCILLDDISVKILSPLLMVLHFY